MRIFSMFFPRNNPIEIRTIFLMPENKLSDLIKYDNLKRTLVTISLIINFSHTLGVVESRQEKYDTLSRFDRFVPIRPALFEANKETLLKTKVYILGIYLVRSHLLVLKTL